MSRAPLLLLSLLACTPDQARDACLGLDVDGDGVCDATAADWSESAALPSSGHRANIYDLPEDALAEVVAAGVGHLHAWPVEPTGLLIPHDPVDRLLTEDEALQLAAKTLLGFSDFEEFYDWLGLSRLSALDLQDPQAPWPATIGEGEPVGAGTLTLQGAEGLTFSCAACHAGSLFGRTVLGLTNRRTRANDVFALARMLGPMLDAETFAQQFDATEAEVAMWARTMENVPAVGFKSPVALGLDTSLAQVALSLARREDDAWATRSTRYEAHPRANPLEHLVADSKPAVWWTLRYKTRWLLDGSIVSGNPVFTNFLWNELGRGTDLHELDTWLHDNAQVVDELTVAAFATEAPRWEDHLPHLPIDLQAAQRGQILFDAHCATCHGVYDKGWDAPDAADRDSWALLETTEVHYDAQTRAIDIGTDPRRSEGMQHFSEALNRLEISQRAGTVVTPQQGYVPPPLDGIWARWPYLHHNAVPTLCALLSPPEERPTWFVQGPADDPDTDFDATCVGYPTGPDIPDAWLEDAEALVDLEALGLSRDGHDAMLTGADGGWLLSEAQRLDLVEYLKTL